jgi:hypothetical protein
VLKKERTVMVDITKATAITAINREGPPRPAFARASQNMVAAALLDTLPMLSAGGVDKVYR